MHAISIEEARKLLVEGTDKVHLVGVAGSGMSGIAALLLALGRRVSGCDRASTVEVERLQRAGLEFHSVQDGSYLGDVSVVVYSSAIRPGNATYDEAARLGRPMMRRAEALAAIMSTSQGILVAGMHGKTTTSAMAAHVLRVGGVRPSHYVGAEIPILGTNARWDPEGQYFVAEGDESDGTIVLYHPEHLLLLNIEAEHLDHYKDLAAIEAVFERVIRNTRGTVFFCGDDPVSARLCGGAAAAKRAVSFGKGIGCDYRFGNVTLTEDRAVFDVWARGERLGEVELGVPGEHNVSNATSVIALATEIGIPFDRIREALAGFRGARRRFEIKYSSPNFKVVDDYAHHPTEIRATLATAKADAGRRVIAIFQPHRYSRTLALKSEFARCFGDADFVCVTDVYPASEPPIEGVSGKTITDALAETGYAGVMYEPDVGRAHAAVGNKLEPGDTLITLGAGNVHEAGARLARDLKVLDGLRAEMGAGLARLYEPMAKHTTMRVGGPAQFWIEPETEEGFARIIRYCRDNTLPLMVVGRGSNLLVRDGGIRGVVVHPARGVFGRTSAEGNEVTAGTGVPFRQVSAAAKGAGIGGFEWMEGIPGDVGGGVRMNAGALGVETFDQVVEVRYLDSDGLAHAARPEDIEVSYRNVPFFKNHFTVQVRFRGYSSDKAEIARRIEQALAKRKATQPAAASAGCVFKNPEACPAGRLIDELGLKDFKVGGARVSDVHGNFVVNDGGARCRDVITIIETIRGMALKERGITLETEVQIVGEEESVC